MHKSKVALTISFFSLFVFLIAGCGYNPEDPAYDTTVNPDNFPARALALIDDIEAGNLTIYDSITMRFADLYTESSDLLDNQAWKDVIDRVGYKFRYRADLAVQKGLPAYTEAASMYLLASFAHPEDTELGEKGQLFATWLDVTGDEDFSSVIMGGAEVQDKLGFLRKFELADSLSRQFSVKHLRLQVLGAQGEGLDAQAVAALEPADRALLASLGIGDAASLEKQAVFEDPSIGLITARVEPEGEGWYLVEMYFLPHEIIEDDLTVAIRVFTSDTTLPRIDDGALGFLPFDFMPHKPTSQWKPGEIYVAAKRIFYESPLEDVDVGLYDRSANPNRFAIVSGSERTTVTLPVSTE